jgi:hypothetical protein
MPMKKKLRRFRLDLLLCLLALQYIYDFPYIIRGDYYIIREDRLSNIWDYQSTRIWNTWLVSQRPHMTVQNYLWALQVFCDWTKKNPDELILGRLSEMASESDFSETLTFKRIMDYQSDDKSKIKCTKTMIVKALISFYESNHASIMCSPFPNI